MKPNPFVNAVAAALYIGAVAVFLRFIEAIRGNTQDTFLDGIAFLSLLVFSAATMAFLFFYQPVVLLIQNRQADALAFFVLTLGTFGAMTVALLVLVGLQTF